MSKGTEKHPVVVRVRTQERLAELIAICNKHNWRYLAEINPGEPEDISDVEQLINASETANSISHTGRNDPCPCGSGLKYKKCCLNK